MEKMPPSVLEDPRYRVPSWPEGQSGLAWLRGSVPRFCDGQVHVRRRRLVEDVVAGIVFDPRPGEDPTVTLLRGMGLPERLWADVEVTAAAYQPHVPVTAAADEAVERLIAESVGGRDETTAARICVLVQAHAATRSLVERRRTGREGPPVPTTRRVGPDGREVEVDLSDAWFGRGAHACPGRELALRLVEVTL